jgi:hypothetical protein
MSIRYLYEFDFTGSQSQRLVQGSSIQALTYTWRGVSSIEELDYYLNIKDTSGSFPTWLQNRGIDKLFVTLFKYNTETEEVEETIKNLYSHVSSDSSTVSLRKCSIPDEHLEDAQKLIADGIVQLYEIKLANNTYLHLKPDNSVQWNGETWAGLPILFEGYSTAQGDSYSRPTLSIANPDTINENDGNARSTLSSLVLPTEDYPYGLLNRAIVNRYLVLYDDIVNDRPIYQKKTWVIWFIKTINKNLIQVELRNPMDGVNFDVPARMYIPPEFPFVTFK